MKGQRTKFIANLQVGCGLLGLALLVSSCFKLSMIGTLESADSSSSTPQVTISSPASSAFVNAANESAFSVSGSCSPSGSAVTVQAGAQSATAVCGSGVFHATLDLSAEAEGPITVTADHDDATQASVTLTKDSIAPTVPGSLTASVVDGSETSAVAFSWTASTDVGGTGLSEYLIALGTSSGGTQLQNYTSVGNVTSKTMSGLSLTYGTTYYITLRASDIAGNLSSATTSWRATHYQGSWSLTTATGAPVGGAEAVAVWTGSKMIIWATNPSLVNGTNLGGVYDPVANSWTATTTTGAPSMRRDTRGVWTGSKLLVWGGYTSSPDTTLASGGLYDPVTNAWSATTLTGAPTARTGHTLVWTGSKAIIWGGIPSLPLTSYLNTGSTYDPASDLWSAITTTSAPVGRYRGRAVWTGSKMIVWGGRNGGGALNVPALYDPASDTWSDGSTVNAPPALFFFSAHWTGSKMIVWGTPVVGSAYGGIYDPTADSWASITATNAPPGSHDHTGVWTGSRLMVWGGALSGGGGEFNDGGIYDPETDTWTSSTVTGAPMVRTAAVSVWTGSKMIVWGGSHFGFESTNVGGIFDPQIPSVDSWSATTTSGAPEGRIYPYFGWTGSKLIVWGGYTSGGTFTTNTGAVYDPVSDSWSTTTLSGAPQERRYGRGVWTGSKFLVWGGYDQAFPGSYLNDGGSYDPVLDSWTSITSTNAPSQRQDYAAIWTGSKMLIWGGSESTTYFNDGGAYDPATDSWSSITTTNAPTAVDRASAVWTGSKMIAWGGTTFSNVVNTGGLYDPVSDSWQATTTTGAPTPRKWHASVWTGSKMIIWGDDSYSNTGALYDPITNSWTSTTITGAPSGRSEPVHVWTGGKMLLWGGIDASDVLNTGALYDPANNTWSTITTAGAPEKRSRGAWAWSGSKMIVWGGTTGGSGVNDGGIYTPGGSSGTTTGDGSAIGTGAR